MDIKHNNKSQSQHKHPTQCLQREKLENWAKKLSGPIALNNPLNKNSCNTNPLQNLIS